MQPYHQEKTFLSRYSSKLVDLVDLHSSTAKAVLAILSPLERPIHMCITFDRETEVLEAHLPRLKLEFLLRKGTTNLESKQFRGMVVDANQAFGTLTGLFNKLVLRGIHDSSRSVLIPHGNVRYMSNADCDLSVRIDTSGKHVSYHLYQIDPQLGRLLDDGMLKSKLFQCYLHAVTSNCLMDELTDRTGTEEALSILSSPSISSFPSLDKE